MTGNQDKTALKTDKGVQFHLDNDPAHKSMVAVAVALNWLITLHIFQIWHHLTISVS